MKIHTSQCSLIRYKVARFVAIGYYLTTLYLGKKYLFGCISAFIGGIFLKIHTLLFPCMRCKGHKFVCNQSTIKGTLFGEQCGESLSENKPGGPTDW